MGFLDAAGQALYLGIYTAVLDNVFIAGDWLIQSPNIGLKLSFHYDPDGTWEHRIADIGPIEVSAPLGGGLASVGNVTLKVLEDGTGQSLVQIWENTPRIEGVEIFIDFLLDDQGGALRIFTGRIDTITLVDAVSEILCVDDSIQRDLLIPQTLVTKEVFPNADEKAVTQPEPLIYGLGRLIPGAPLMLIDLLTNTYLVAAHPMQLGGTLAVFDRPTATFLQLPSVHALNNPGSATITLGTLDGGTMTVQQQGAITFPGNVIDGNSQSLAYIATNFTDSNGVDGIGYLGVTAGQTGYPTTPTIQVTLTNHRRLPGSDPTVSCVFSVRTIDPRSNAVLRNLLITPAFRHGSSAQNDILTLTDVNIAADEVLEVMATARCEGEVGGVLQAYEIGEISITPVVTYSVGISGQLTAIQTPFNIQNARFNHISHVLSVFLQSYVGNAQNAVDGISTTLCNIFTSGVDSNLDGYGRLVVGCEPTSAQRANNTIVVNMINHRRSLFSTPTVTGTFSIQTYARTNGPLLRDNLFVTQQFRQSLRPLTTSFTAASINLGRTGTLAVQLLARNEGGPGGDPQHYDLGEISLESFYQPQGDNELFLSGEGWSGRFDVDGTVTAYAGLGIGTLLRQPDQIVASMLLTELSARLNLVRFAAAYSFYAANNYFFDGGIGFGWAVTRKHGREILDDLAKQAIATLSPTFDGGFSLVPYRPENLSSFHFDITNILYTEGAEDQDELSRSSTFQIVLGNIQYVHNRFEVHYAYNTGNGLYDKVYYVDGLSNNLPETHSQKARLGALCERSLARYGPLEPDVVEAYWIGEDEVALKLITHRCDYFARQRIQVTFETTYKAILLEVGQFVTIDYPTLPAAEREQLYEIHTIRYLPVTGRMQFVCSKFANNADNLIVVPARMEWKAQPTLPSNPFLVTPTQVAWQAAAIAPVLIDEPWEFDPVLNPIQVFAEAWAS